VLLEPGLCFILAQTTNAKSFAEEQNDGSGGMTPVRIAIVVWPCWGGERDEAGSTPVQLRLNYAHFRTTKGNDIAS